MYRMGTPYFVTAIPHFPKIHPQHACAARIQWPINALSFPIHYESFCTGFLFTHWGDALSFSSGMQIALHAKHLFWLLLIFLPSKKGRLKYNNNKPQPVISNTQLNQFILFFCPSHCFNPASLCSYSLARNCDVSFGFSIWCNADL